MHLFTLIFHNGICFGPPTRLHFSDDLSLQLPKGIFLDMKETGILVQKQQSPKKTSLEHGPGFISSQKTPYSNTVWWHLFGFFVVFFNIYNHVDISTCKTLSNT